MIRKEKKLESNWSQKRFLKEFIKNKSPQPLDFTGVTDSTKKISTHLLTVLIIGVIFFLEQIVT